jgi:hypothetical protein
MKTRPLPALCLFAAAYAPAAVLYVDSNNTDPFFYRVGVQQ